MFYFRREREIIQIDYYKKTRWLSNGASVGYHVDHYALVEKVKATQVTVVRKEMVLTFSHTYQCGLLTAVNLASVTTLGRNPAWPSSEG